MLRIANLNFNVGDYIYWEREKEWKRSEEIRHEPFNPELDKLEEYKKFLMEDLSIGTGIPVSQLFGSVSEEIATEDPPEDRGYSVVPYHSNSKTKQHPMDRHYPHLCFHCKKDLHWKELLLRNLSYKYKLIVHQNKKLYIVKQWLEAIKQYHYLKQLWRSSVVQFYCCSCYGMAKVIEEMEEEKRNGKET